MSEIEQIGVRARLAAQTLAHLGDGEKDAALVAMADALDKSCDVIVEANGYDMSAAADAPPSTRDRLRLDRARVEAMGGAVRAVASQRDPVGETIKSWATPTGLEIRKVRVALGVVAVIYEARPNVTADVAALCLKSGNAAILRGSSQAIRSNIAITQVLREAISAAGLPIDCVQLVEDTSREAALELMKLDACIDLLIPRGGPALIASVKEHASVPYIIDGDGNCHVYVDASADQEMATNIVINAKTSRPGVCNAAETLLVHQDIVGSWLPGVLDRLGELGVEIRGDERVAAIWPRASQATDEDWACEFLDLIIAVKVVGSIDEAIDHIAKWGTSNAEAIVTSDPTAAEHFSRMVDSGTVFINASTRFSDGGQFGFGSEIGISTQKLHARGPMGAEELTTYKYVVEGEGQIRH
ncbi:MAG: glutamate-5-semialdehyde dehydrogenase [Actinomycetota bacterium]